MDFLQYIQWGADPTIVEIGPLALRWYGLLFASAFLIGQQIMFKIYHWEGKPQTDVDNLTIYMLVATVIGARLGHCLFYNPDYYLSNPVKILMIWEGGLASHGGAFGILFALWLYARKHPDQAWLWVVDRIVITVALGGAFIRLGNFFNHEIVGLPTDLPWGVVFENCSSCVLPDGTNPPRHPAQLYESISCFILFFVLLWMYVKQKAQLPHGRLLGLFLIWVFGLRPVWEIMKVNQEAFEDHMLLNMGQLLSIPLFLAGIYIFWRSFQPQAKPKNMTNASSATKA